jgi:peptidoglycan-associated lipoprotein
MNRNHLLVVSALLLGLVLPGCGKKRPPLTAAERAGRSASGAGSSTSTTTQGSGLNPLGEEGGMGTTDFAVSDASGEGGPLTDIYFDYDQATLSDAARAALEKHARWIQARPTARITVEGHCDERGTVEYNLALGDRRAQVTRDYLVGLGVPKNRLNAVSFGKERPVDPGHEEGAWAKNRRAHFAVAR